MDTDSSSEPIKPAQASPLDDLECRLLGVLIEKALSNPAYYPMTLNAVVLACNQKQNRDPVIEESEGRVFQTLERLREKGLVLMIVPGSGGRVDRFGHEAKTRLGWSPRQQAVMAELLLRGPQTAGELRSRCSRMVPFATIGEVNESLDELRNTNPPCVAAMEREPGRSAIRFRQLLGRQPNQPAQVIDIARAAPLRSNDEDGDPAMNLRATVQRLESQVHDLEQRVERLEASVESESDG